MIRLSYTVNEQMVEFRGAKVEVTSLRIPKDEQKAGLYYYGIRHSDDDLGLPVTVEPFVLVNHFGTLISDKPITMDVEDDLIVLNEEEQEAFMEVI